MQITQKRLRELFKYEDGFLIRIAKTSNNTKVGDIAGTSTDTTGYAVVRIDGATQKVHRMIWIYHNGKIEDKYIIDHKDKDKSNNKIENLRKVTKQENSFNSSAKGYYYHKKLKKWRAMIGINGKRKSLGCFETEAEAKVAYQNAKKELHKIGER